MGETPDTEVSEAQFRLFQEQSPDGFGLLRPVRTPAGEIDDFIFEYINEAGAKTIGHSIDTVIGGLLTKFEPPVCDRDLIEIYIDVMDGGEMYQGDYRRPNSNDNDEWYRLTAVQVQDDLAISFIDITEAVQIKRRAEINEQRLEAVQQASPDGLTIYQSIRDKGGEIIDFNIDYVNPTGADVIGYSEAELLGQSLIEMIPGVREEGLFDIYKAVVATGDDYNNELEFHHGRVNGTFETTVFRIGDGVAVSFKDISERHEAERHKDMLMAELNHRLKNSLATIQAMANHTLRGTDSVDEFRKSFTGRLSAIAASHDALIGEGQQKAGLRNLIKRQLKSYISVQGQRLDLNGPPIRLSANMAHALGLVFHELATNASKYGALSVEAGIIHVDWTLTHINDKPGIHLVWKEEGGPSVTAPTRSGFGSRLIENTLSYSLGGELDIEYNPAGIIAALKIPIEM